MSLCHTGVISQRNDKKWFITAKQKLRIKKWSRGPLSANLSVLPDILFISHMGSIYFCSSIEDVRIRFYSKYCCSNISQLKNRIIGIERTSRAFFPDIPLFHSGLPKPFPKCILFVQTLRKKHPTVCFRVQHGQCWKLLPSQSKCIQSKSTFFSTSMWELIKIILNHKILAEKEAFKCHLGQWFPTRIILQAVNRPVVHLCQIEFWCLESYTSDHLGSLWRIQISRLPSPTLDPNSVGLYC